jgi:oxygen-independent coproporphyrinogen-3 oxidase
LPTPEAKLQLLKMAVERLTENNRYIYIGMDHFARPHDELAVAQRQKRLQRNFQGYSTHADADIYAFGMSSVSQVPQAYWQNHKDLGAYRAALDAGRMPIASGYLITDDDRIRRETIMRMMCDLSLDFAEMSERLEIDFNSYFERELDTLTGFDADGLVRFTRAGLVVTDIGRLFVRNIAMCFDNTLAPVSDRKHSRTV